MSRQQELWLKIYARRSRLLAWLANKWGGVIICDNCGIFLPRAKSIDAMDDEREILLCWDCLVAMERDNEYSGEDIDP